MRNNSNFSFSASVTCIHFLISMLSVVEKIAGTVFWLSGICRIRTLSYATKNSQLFGNSVSGCFPL